MANVDVNPSVGKEIVATLTIPACIILSPLLRPWYSRWGATAEEVARTLPGDDLTPNPAIQSTRAITIHAPATTIWPWLVQMGQGRGGLYSFERLENLAGSQMHNAGRIIPELQNLKAGDSIHLDPRQPALPVYAVEPNHHLIFLASAGTKDGPADGQSGMPDGYYRMSWLFYLDAIDERATRLIIRTRSDYKRKFASVLLWRVMTDPMSFVMERQMLAGIKQRAERLNGSMM